MSAMALALTVLGFAAGNVLAAPQADKMPEPAKPSTP